MGMNPMGGDASSIPPMQGGDPMMDGDLNTMGGNPGDMTDPMMDSGANEPVMGANPFGGDDEGNADVSGDPEKKAESLAGQLASIFRNDLKNDGINKHEDKKKEVLGMIASAVVDGMDDEDRNSMIEYLSDKLNGSGESDGDDSSDDGNGDNNQNNSNDNFGGTQQNDPMMNGNMMTDQSQQMMESRVNEVVNEIVGDLIKKRESPKSKVDQEDRQGYRGKPYTVKKR